MHIRDILAGSGPKFSFEYFPPRSAEASEALFRTISELQACSPAFVSVTYGAGGTTRTATRELVLRLQRETQVATIPHLTCIGHTRKEISQILETYANAGISNILALRGDPPRSTLTTTPSGDFVHAADLVHFIRRFSERHRHPFGIGVAGFPEGHPATPNRLKELDHLKAKIDAGADYICTQLFFDNHDFLDFRDRCHLAGIQTPILAGIMPVTTLHGLHRMAELAGGTRVPARLLRALQRANQDADSIRHIGIHYATAQCSQLLDHQVDGIHLYTLNQSSASLEIFNQLGILRDKAPSALKNHHETSTRQ